MKIQRILCCCMAGMGSSFLVELNLKKALDAMGRSDILVDHAGVYDAVSGAADLFICSADIVEECEKAGPSIPLNRLTDYHELESKLQAFFQEHEVER